MKPTQKQIDAALRYSDCEDKRKDLFALLSYNVQASSYPIAAMRILAAAYREKCEELESMREDLVKHIQLCHEALRGYRAYRKMHPEAFQVWACAERKGAAKLARKIATGHTTADKNQPIHENGN